MKRVFSNNSEVCHIWASRKQEQGKANSVFFEKDVIFSYGRHFPIAKFHEKNNQVIVLFTTKGYSVTTAKHKSIAYSAVSHYKKILVPDVHGDHKENLDYFLNEIAVLKRKSISARSNGQYYFESLENLCKDLKEYCLFFSLAVSKEIKQIINAYENKSLITEMERAKIKEHIKLKKAETKRNKEKLLNKLKAWQENNSNYDFSFGCLPVKLRTKNNRIETSHGASVSYEDGFKLYNALKQGQNVHGFNVGVYTVERIDGNNVIIGCHTIALSEIKNLFEERHTACRAAHRL